MIISKHIYVPWRTVWTKLIDNGQNERRYLQIFAIPTTAAAAKLLHSCPTLCDPIDSSPPGFPIPGILQARTLEWVAISFCNAWKWKVKVKLLSRVWLLETPWTTAYQAPPSMGFSRQEYWSGVPSPSPPYNGHDINIWNTKELLQVIQKKIPTPRKNGQGIGVGNLLKRKPQRLINKSRFWTQ